MGFARTCGSFIVICLQFSIKEALTDYVKLCDKRHEPALTIFQSGILSNVSTGYINLASQSGEESQCTITPVNTLSVYATLQLSFVKSSKTDSMSICIDQAQNECVEGTSTRVVDIKCPKTLYYKADALYTGEAACLMIHVDGGAVNVACFDRQNNSSAAVNRTMDEGIQTTGFLVESLMTMTWDSQGGMLNTNYKTSSTDGKSICTKLLMSTIKRDISKAVKDTDKMCDRLQMKPALTIFQSGVLTNVNKGYINLASQLGEESQCTIFLDHTNFTPMAYVSLEGCSETHFMSICTDQNHTTDCVNDTRTTVELLFRKSTTTLYYRTDKQYTGQAACLAIEVKNTTANITCYDRKNTTSSTTQVYPTTGAGVSSTGTMNETFLFSTEPIQTKINYTQAWSDKGENSNSSGTAAAVPVISAVASVFGVLLVVAVSTLLLVKYRKSKQATNTGDVETENPLYNTDANTVTEGRYLATLATDETQCSYASTKENEKKRNDTADESSNRTDAIVLTRSDLAENTDYNEIMPLTVMNDTNNAAPQDDQNANEYSIIDEENGQDEMDTSGKAGGCSDTYYSQIEIHEEDNKTVHVESTSAILSGSAFINSITMSKDQQVEPELDSEYHHINDTVMATPFNEYDRIPRHVSKKDCTRDSTYNHVWLSRCVEHDS